ncbi:uncharacterized protein, partial [Pyxicephalus adspersus]|uniref:uncharacterized protein n=1 Tax=Pyxicephalus adspersus TaxID=30357 RepID=UPI003B5A2EDE
LYLILKAGNVLFIQSSEPPGPSLYRRGSNSASIPSLSHLDNVSVSSMSRVSEPAGLERYDRVPFVDTLSKCSHFVLMSCRECLYFVGSLPRLSYDPAADSCYTLLGFCHWLKICVTFCFIPSRNATLNKKVCVCVLFSFTPSFVCYFMPVHSLPLCQEISELKEQIEDVEGRYMQGLKEMKVPVCVALINLFGHVGLDVVQSHHFLVHGFLGSSKEAVEKKETMSVVGEIPPSKTEQHEQKIPLTTPPETQLNAEGGDKAIEQNIQISSNSNDEANTGGTQCGFRSNLENPEEDLKLNLKSTSNEYEMAVDECTPENLNKVDLEQNFSEVHRETSVDQRDTSPVESEVFQDALEEIVQSPLVGSQLSEEHIVAVEDFRNEDYDTSQQDFKKEEDKCEVQSTSVESSSDPNNKASELSEGGDNAGVTTDDMINLHTDTKDDNETSNPDDSSQDDSEESTSDEITSTVADPEKETRPEELSVPIESVLQWKEDDSGKTDSDPNCTSEEKSVSADTSIHPSDHDVEEEENIHVTQKQSSQGIELTKEEHQLVDSENNTFGEVSEPCTVINEQSTVVESESLRNSKDSEPSISHVKQCEDATDSESLNANLESLKNLKVDSSGNELLDKREQDTHSDNLMYDTSKKTNNELNTVLSDASGIEELNEEKPDISDHPVCDRSVNLHEETNT